MRRGFGGRFNWGKRQPKAELDAQSRLLLFVQGLYLLGNAFSDTFVGVYLWKLNNDLLMIAWFFVAQYVAMALTLWIAGKQVKEGNKMNALRLGVGVAALFYLLVLLLGARAVTYILPLGALQGAADGLFWLANNVVYFEVTDRENRDRFNGFAGLLTSFSYMIAPWIAGYLITRISDPLGYHLIFSLSLGVFLVGVVASFFLKKRQAQDSYGWLFGVRQIAERGGPWGRISAAMAAQGVREGVFSFAIGLLVYIATRNEMQLGNYSLITSAIGIISYPLAGRLFERRNRLWGSLVGIVAIILAIFPFYWEISYATLLVFGIMIGVFFPLYTIPLTSVVFDVIGRDEESASRRVEYIVLREMALNAGRVFGTLVFIGVLAQEPSHPLFTTLLVLLGSAPLAAWVLLRKWLADPVDTPVQGP
ncbi:MFS transporter [Paenibacillus xerothermodurans]|uniref:MFS transporter n=2 Tax=Paenibacillus xerothermodurans TaxID=1977292 RepID=A0A2W1NI61_PAEXE|nr:MFS transporter [Paenibacillus xerothermodurans]